jgi:hypothetical protein
MNNTTSLVAALYHFDTNGNAFFRSGGAVLKLVPAVLITVSGYISRPEWPLDFIGPARRAQGETLQLYQISK